MQLVGRFAYFAIAAHVLGPTSYGTFVACTALIAAMSPFASFGTENVLMKYVARDRTTLPQYFGNALLVTFTFASLLTVLALLIRSTVLPASAAATTLIAVALADLFGTKTTVVCLHAFSAMEQFRRYVQLATGSTGLRVAAALILLASEHSASQWAWLYAGSTLLGAVAGIAAVSRCGGRPHFRRKLIIPSMREGFHFSTAAASKTIYDDIDKTMLARLSSVGAAAIYAVAYRFVDAAMMPIRSLAAAAYPEFFRRGAKGVDATFGLARRILRHAVWYGIAVALLLFFSAGLLPLIMGRAYAESVAALRWLCVLPVIKSVHAFLTDTLTGADYQWQRSLIQILCAGFNIAANYWLIRAFAWRGAAWSSVITDSLLALLLYVAIHGHLRRERRPSREPLAEPILASGDH